MNQRISFDSLVYGVKSVPKIRVVKTWEVEACISGMHASIPHVRFVPKIKVVKIWEVEAYICLDFSNVLRGMPRPKFYSTAGAGLAGGAYYS